MDLNRKLTLAIVAAGGFLCGLGSPSVGSAQSVVYAPEKFFPALENGVPGSYIVTLFAVPAASAAPELVSSVGGELGYVYRHAFNGFEAGLTEFQAEQCPVKWCTSHEVARGRFQAAGRS